MEATSQAATPTTMNILTIKSFLTVKDFSTKHPLWTQASLRWLIFNRQSNGFASVFRKVGRKVMIDEAAFFEKIENCTMEA